MTAEVSNAPAAPEQRSRLVRTLGQLALIRESKVGLIGVVIILFWIVVALLADIIAPFDPNASVNARFLEPFSSSPISPGAYQQLTVEISGLPDDAVLSAGERQEDGRWLVPGRDLSGLRLTLPESVSGTIRLQAGAYEAGDPFMSGALTYDVDAVRALVGEESEEEEDPYAAYGDAYGQQAQPADEAEEDLSLPIDVTQALPENFVLGTDHLGRDILSRIIHGSRTVLIYAPIATFCAYVVGILLGLAAGYYRGLMDTVLSFVANVILAFPVLVLYVITITLIGASGLNIVLAVTFASAPGIMRIVRGLTLDLRNREYIAAAQTRGESAWYIMIVELLPNARGPLIVDACLRLGYVTITIGVLGFLGLGLPPPDPDWGGMVNDARNNGALSNMHTALFPCLAISSLVLGLNLLADGLREVSLKD